MTPIPSATVGQNNTNTTIGPGFWPVTRNFASLNAEWIPQLSLATNDFDQLGQQARAVVVGIGLENIESLEVGNEPDLFPLREAGGPPTWSGSLDNAA